MKILYPDEREVSEKQIRLWYYDALENGDADNPTNMPNTEYAQIVPLVTIVDDLTDAGLVTFSADWDNV